MVKVRLETIHVSEYIQLKVLNFSRLFTLEYQNMIISN